MDRKHQAAPNREYEDFEPKSEWVEEEVCDTLLLYLPGFKKEQLKVQLTTTKNLRISGERQLRENKWNRFLKEFPVSANCEAHKITAKFEDGILYVRQPKLITPAAKEDKEKPTSEAPGPQKPADEPQPQKNVQEKDSDQKMTSMTTQKTNGLANAKELSNADGNKSESIDAKNVSEKPSERERTTDTNSVSEKTQEEEKSEKHENLGDNSAKTESGTTSNVDADGKAGAENYKQPVGELTEKLKKPRKLMNLVLLVVIVALVLGMYVTNMIRSSKILDA
uniref:Putative inactive protein RESTRICTED TEV MOVEMENT 2-like n=1 Tax=Davidia involucrata TaxID=16924 RepID=A0A5B7BWT1_DAVIN